MDPGFPWILVANWQYYLIGTANVIIKEARGAAASVQLAWLRMDFWADFHLLMIMMKNKTGFWKCFGRSVSTEEKKGSGSRVVFNGGCSSLSININDFFSVNPVWVDDSSHCHYQILRLLLLKMVKRCCWQSPKMSATMQWWINLFISGAGKDSSSSFLLLGGLQHHLLLNWIVPTCQLRSGRALKQPSEIPDH